MNTAVLTRPSLAPADNKPPPRWLLILFRDDKQTADSIEAALVKVLKLGSVEAKTLAKRVQDNGGAVIWRGPREKAEEYFDLLKQEELNVDIQPES